MLAFKKKTYVLSSYNTLVLPVPTVTPVRLAALTPVSWGGSPAQTGQARGAHRHRNEDAECLLQQGPRICRGGTGVCQT